MSFEAMKNNSKNSDALIEKLSALEPHLYFTIPTDFRDREVGISKTPVPPLGRRILSPR